MIVNLDYQNGGSELTDLIIKCNSNENENENENEEMQKEEFKNEPFIIFANSEYTLVTLNCDRFEEGPFIKKPKIPQIHSYNDYTSTPQLAFRISNIFYNNLPDDIKGIIISKAIDTSLVDIFFCPQRNSNLYDGYPNKGFELLRPQYYYLPGPNQNKWGQSANIDFQLETGIFCYDNSIESVTHNNFNQISSTGYSVHPPSQANAEFAIGGVTVSSDSPQIRLNPATNNLIDRPSAFWSLVIGNGKCAVTLHWLFDGNLFIDINKEDQLKKLCIYKNTFNLLISEIEEKDEYRYFRDVLPSLTDLLA